MFLAHRRQTAWINARKSLLPYRGLQEYKSYRERVFKKEVCLYSLFDLFLIFRTN